MARAFTNAVSNYINMGSPAVLQPASVSMSCWIKVNQTATFCAVGGMDLGGFARGYLLDDSGTTISWRVGNGSWSTITGNTLSTGVWRHLLGTYDGTTQNYYEDGVSQGPLTPSITLLYTSTEFDVARYGTSVTTSQMFGGSIADVAVWNVALSQIEATALAKGIRPNLIRRGALVGYWPLDGLASPEPDLSGNLNNGTITGSPTLASGPPFAPFTPRWPMGAILPMTLPPPPTFVLMPQIVM
jgi:hypothetical protein